MLLLLLHYLDDLLQYYLYHMVVLKMLDLSKKIQLMKNLHSSKILAKLIGKFSSYSTPDSLIIFHISKSERSCCPKTTSYGVLCVVSAILVLIEYITGLKP